MDKDARRKELRDKLRAIAESKDERTEEDISNFFILIEEWMQLAIQASKEARIKEIERQLEVEMDSITFLDLLQEHQRLLFELNNSNLN